MKSDDDDDWRVHFSRLPALCCLVKERKWEKVSESEWKREERGRAIEVLGEGGIIFLFMKDYHYYYCNNDKFLYSLRNVVVLLCLLLYLSTLSNAQQISIISACGDYSAASQHMVCIFIIFTILYTTHDYLKFYYYYKIILF